MFETLYSYPSVLKRHRKGPLAAERAAYLGFLAARGYAHGTLLRQAACCLCVARAIEGRGDDGVPWTTAEIDRLAASWARRRVARGRAAAMRWPLANFRLVATEFLRFLQRLDTPSPTAPSPHAQRVEEFLTAQSERWASPETRRSARWQVFAFLTDLDAQGRLLQSVRPDDLDAFFHRATERWSRVSMHTSAKVLKAFFRYAERKGWVQAGVADAILMPRLYRHEDVPPGPNWEQVREVIARIDGEDAAALRDRAILMLLSVYGLRSGEVRRLRIDDIDWKEAKVRVVRSKSLRPQTLPLESGVGEAIARYLHDGRPKSSSRIVFLTLTAPPRALSSSGLYNVVEHHLARVTTVKRGRGPHGLRHACARRLIQSGRSFNPSLKLFRPFGHTG